MAERYVKSLTSPMLENFKDLDYKSRFAAVEHLDIMCKTLKTMILINLNELFEAIATHISDSNESTPLRLNRYAGWFVPARQSTQIIRGASCLRTYPGPDQDVILQPPLLHRHTPEEHEDQECPNSHSDHFLDQNAKLLP